MNVHSATLADETAVREVFSLIKKVDQISVLRAKTIKWLSGSTPEQLERLRSLYTDFWAKPEYEQTVLRETLNPLTHAFSHSSVVALHDAVDLHRALLVPKIINGARHSGTRIVELVLGLRKNPRVPLDLSTPQKRREAEALLSFTFEICGRGAEVVSRFHVHSIKATYSKLLDPALERLVIQNPDKAERLASYYLRGTTDAELLSMMIEEETSIALTEGTL